VAYAFVGWLVGAGPVVHATSLLLYVGLLLLLVGLNAAYYEFVLPYLAPRGLSRLWQVLGLALLTIGVFRVIFASAAFVRRDDAFDLWWQNRCSHGIDWRRMRGSGLRPDRRLRSRPGDHRCAHALVVMCPRTGVVPRFDLCGT
jgi:branched-subunit amino acid ABC-type transport system permease component